MNKPLRDWETHKLGEPDLVLDWPDLHRYARDADDLTARMEQGASELKELFEQHRGFQGVTVRVVRARTVVCKHCGEDPEEDPDEGPCCCDDAIDDWKKWQHQQKVERDMAERGEGTQP